MNNSHFSRILLLSVFVVSLCLTGCSGNKQEQQAQARYDGALALVQEGRWDAAKTELDSIHILYRQQVPVRRQAKALQDSITYLEAQRTLAYSDSVLQELLPQVDPLLKKFRYEKDEKYESNGQYVSRLLTTDRNMQRCFLQAYVGDNRLTRVKSYYYGATPLNQQQVELMVRTAEEPEVMGAGGTCHAFEADGHYSILTAEGDDAIALLAFVDAHRGERIRVKLTGKGANGKDSPYTYYLNDNEKMALAETLQLAVLFNDIQRLENAIRLANAQILYYQSRRDSVAL